MVENNVKDIRSEQSSDGIADLPFAVREAYNRLRTNVIYSIPKKDDGSGIIIGVTSSAKGEGKSSTSVNLARSLAEAGNEVLLIDSDLRMPNVHTQLKMLSVPGLSDYLVSQSDRKISIRPVSADENCKFYVIAAGTLPPNPSELLSSARMESLLKALSAKFQYIIVDLPPIGIVTDALIVSKCTDGMLLVVREDYAHKRGLEDAISQLNLAQAKILGFVLNDVKGSVKRYGGKKNYGYYQ